MKVLDESGKGVSAGSELALKDLGLPVSESGEKTRSSDRSSGSGERASSS